MRTDAGGEGHLTATIDAHQRLKTNAPDVSQAYPSTFFAKYCILITNICALPTLPREQSVLKVFNFVIAKIFATTEITEFREIRPKFRRNFFRD